VDSAAGAVDSAGPERQTAWMTGCGPIRERLAGVQNAAYGDGLLSEHTLAHRRDLACDVVLTGPTVSRRHVRLCFRDGAWILQDLESTNGTLVNHRRVVRCRVIPGDRLDLGGERLTVD
jgi:pSer/pThr/pTyr-binding forkhead associated (FHA) protein